MFVDSDDRFGVLVGTKAHTHICTATVTDYTLPFSSCSVYSNLVFGFSV